MNYKYNLSIEMCNHGTSSFMYCKHNTSLWVLGSFPQIFILNISSTIFFGNIQKGKIKFSLTSYYKFFIFPYLECLRALLILLHTLSTTFTIITIIIWETIVLKDDEVRYKMCTRMIKRIWIFFKGLLNSIGI